MDKELIKLLNRLYNSILSDDFIDVAYEVTEKLEEQNNAFDAVEPILKLMETNPSIDFGLPGPLVHFVENFYKNGYEEKLIESLERHPTKHTVWMLNRIINGSEGERKRDFINVLNKISGFQNLDPDVMSLVTHFKTIHE